MRRLAGIILIVTAFSAFAFADQGSSPLPSNRQRHFDSTSDRPGARSFNGNSGLFTVDDLQGLQFDDKVCYTMHTLVVAREKGTDSTRIVRQQTCTPSDRFRVNHSVRSPRVVK